MKTARDLIPGHWTGEEALLVVSFLEDLFDAITERYQGDMEIDMRRKDWFAEHVLPGVRPDPKKDGDDFPF